MIGTFSSKLIAGIGIAAALFWTVTLALLYGLVAFADDVWPWLNGLIAIPPELLRWLTAAGAWLAQFGAWLLIIVWALGLVSLLLLALFARRLVNLIPKLQREGGLS